MYISQNSILASPKRKELQISLLSIKSILHLGSSSQGKFQPVADVARNGRPPNDPIRPPCSSLMRLEQHPTASTAVLDNTKGPVDEVHQSTSTSATQYFLFPPRKHHLNLQRTSSALNIATNPAPTATKQQGRL